MATLTRTWDWELNDMGMTPGTGSSSLLLAWLTSEHALRFSSSTRNLANVSKSAVRTTTGETWETWGVPAGATVTAVQITGWSYRLGLNTGMTAAHLNAELLAADGTNLTGGQLLNVTLPTTPTSASAYTAGAAGASAAVLPAYQASTTDVRLSLDFSASSSSSTNIQYNFDNVALTITYTPAGGGGPPAAATPAALLMAM